MRKALCIGVYNPRLIFQASPHCGDNVFAKGLEENGYEVIRFDYRLIKEPNQELVRLVTSMKEKPEIVWFGKAERILPSTINVLRQALPDAIFVKWAADVRNEPTAHDLGHLKHIDLFLGTFAGEYLKKHKKVMLQNSKAISMVAFTDSSFYKKTTKNKLFNSDILWTGRLSSGDNYMRNDIIDFLLHSNYHSYLFGIENTKWIQDEYVTYINNTKIGVGSSQYNRRLYSSDRIGNYMSCGCFYLTQYFEGIENIFKRGIHLDWFENIDEMKDKIEYYLKHDNEREEIAKNGREFVLKHFDSKPLVKNILHVISYGESQYSWDEVY